MKRAIDGTILGIVGEDVLRSLYKHLSDRYDISPDELPYRLDTLFEAVEDTFGVRGARTLGKAIARRFYFDHGLHFVETEGDTLQDYLEQAKRQLERRSIFKGVVVEELEHQPS